MKYLLDTNIFIEPKNSYYAFPLCPGYWDWLKICKDIGSVSEVRKELLDGNDELVTWVKKELKPSWFLDIGEIDIQESYQTIVNYVESCPFEEPVKQEFYKCADGWLVAAALAKNATIVTHEKFDLNTKRRITIPYVANHFSIKVIKLFELLHHYKVSFFLDPKYQSPISDFQLSP